MMARILESSLYLFARLSDAFQTAFFDILSGGGKIFPM